MIYNSVEVIVLRLKELREKRGIQQKYLSNVLQIAPNTLSQYENNKREPDYKTLKKIADYFEVSVDYILGNTDIEESQSYASNENIIFGQRLKQLRKSHNLTQLEFAKIFNIANGTIGNWESGNREPDFNTLNRIADFFNVSTDYLLGKTDNRNPWQPELSEKDEKDIAKEIEKLREKLENSEGLMFDGEPATPEAIESVIEAMSFGIKQATLLNKKYTPKKYRK